MAYSAYPDEQVLDPWNWREIITGANQGCFLSANLVEYIIDKIHVIHKLGQKRLNIILSVVSAKPFWYIIKNISSRCLALVLNYWNKFRCALNDVSPAELCRYFTTLTMWAQEALVASDWLCIHKSVCGGGGHLCALQQGTAWPYSFNGIDCYCGSLQHNLKTSRADVGGTGTKPPGFIAFPGDSKLFIPGDHKVGSQCERCGVSSFHNKQSALFHTGGVDSSPCQRLGWISCRDTPVHSSCEEFIKLRAAFQSVLDQDWVCVMPSPLFSLSNWMVLATKLKPWRHQQGFSVWGFSPPRRDCQTNFNRFPRMSIKAPPSGSKGSHHGTFITYIGIENKYIWRKEPPEGIMVSLDVSRAVHNGSMDCIQ